MITTGGRLPQWTWTGIKPNAPFREKQDKDHHHCQSGAWSGYSTMDGQSEGTDEAGKLNRELSVQCSKSNSRRCSRAKLLYIG